jgi:hypothetical protein
MLARLNVVEFVEGGIRANFSRFLQHGMVGNTESGNPSTLRDGAPETGFADFSDCGASAKPTSGQRHRSPR